MRRTEIYAALNVCEGLIAQACTALQANCSQLPNCLMGGYELYQLGSRLRAYNRRTYIPCTYIHAYPFR